MWGGDGCGEHKTDGHHNPNGENGDAAMKKELLRQALQKRTVQTGVQDNL